MISGKLPDLVLFLACWLKCLFLTTYHKTRVDSTIKILHITQRHLLKNPKIIFRHDNCMITSNVAVRVLVRVNMHDVTSHVWRHQIKILKVKFIIGKSPSDIYGNKIRNTNFMGFRLILKKKLDTSPSVVYGKKSRHECSEWFFCHL